MKLSGMGLTTRKCDNDNYIHAMRAKCADFYLQKCED